MTDTALNWHLSDQEILQQASKLIDKSTKTTTNIKTLDANNKANINIFLALLADDITEVTNFHTMISFLYFVTPSELIKLACNKADLLLSTYITQLNTDPQIYTKLLEFGKKLDNTQDRQFISRLQEEYEKSGVKLNAQNRTMLTKITTEIEKIELNLITIVGNFQKKLITLTPQQMLGMPPQLLKNYKKKNMNYEIALDPKTYAQLMRYLQDENTRENLELTNTNLFINISDEIARLLVLRHKKAQLLGFSNWAEYKLTPMMAGSTKSVKEFLLIVNDRLQARYNKEIEMLKNLKKIDVKRGHALSYDSINNWDVSYYLTRWRKKYGLQESQIREFFPLPHVLTTMLSIYAEMFQIKTKRISNKNIWHDEVATYLVCDKNNNLLGYFYLDLYHRPGKSQDIRCFGLRLPCVYPLASNKIQTPLVALVASFKNNLLLHSEMLGLFHEFTHVLHLILGATKYSLFSGTNVEADFVETPALVMEGLVWNSNIIARLSGHYKTAKPLPEIISKKMGKIRDLSLGIHYKKHILLSIYDQLVHSSGELLNLCELVLTNVDLSENSKREKLAEALTSIYKELHNKFIPDIALSSDQIDNNKVFPIDWVTMLIGNDARFYSSLWAKIYSTEILNKKVKDGIIDNNLGLDLAKLMRYGGTKSSFEMVRDIIGTTPTIEGFFDYYDIDSDVEQSYFFSSDKFKTENIAPETETQENYYTEGDNQAQAQASEWEADADALLYIKDKLDNHIDNLITETESGTRYQNIFMRR